MRDQKELDLEAGQTLLMALFGTVRRMRATGSNEAIDLPSIYVLQVVMVNPDIRVSELAGQVGLDASTVSRHVRGLEEVGYLSRMADPKDKRASRVRLSDAGSDVIQDALRSRAAMITTAMAEWSVEDRTRFVELAIRFASDIEKLAPGS
jgi:DNA-binding MarR family transcriptional regulator